MFSNKLIHNFRCGQGYLKHVKFQTTTLNNLRTNQSLFRSLRSSAKCKNSLQSIPFEGCNGSHDVPPSTIVKAFMFTGAFTVGSFLGAAIVEYESTRNRMMEKARNTKTTWLMKKVSNENWLNQIAHKTKSSWDHLTSGDKVFVPICALNILVFGLWRVPRLRQTMLTYFASSPNSRAVCWPMFLSTFSHYSAFHLIANMYVLHSFANPAVTTMGKEQFVAMYLSAGVISSMTSVLYKALTAQNGISIGASGAIMGVLAYVCSLYPDTQLSILFFPMITFSAGHAIKVIMGVDAAGCALGWKFFDHAAHLGGALFGIGWAKFGNDLWQQRLSFLSSYHDVRKRK